MCKFEPQIYLKIENFENEVKAKTKVSLGLKDV
jgi:hypothetical protein